jgi:uncharacterized membrane protein
MGILLGVSVIILIAVFIYKQLNSDGITGQKIKKYLIYIILLISFLIIFLIIKL